MYPATFWEERRGLPKGDISDAALFMNQRTVKLHRKSTHIEKETAKVGRAVLKGSLSFGSFLFPPVQVHAY